MNKRITAPLLAVLLLCTGCASQNSSTVPEPYGTPAVTDAAETESAAETVPESTDAQESADDTAAALTDAAPSGEDAAVPVTDPPVQAETDEDSPYASVMIEGQFTATVRAKLPDYVSDEETVQAAVLQLFQDIPFFIRLTPEICEQIEAGEIYVFHVPEQELTTAKTNLFDDGTLSPDAVIRSYAVIDSVRKPQEDEYGLDTWNVSYKTVS